MADGINSGETRVEKKMNEVKMKRTSSPDTEKGGLQSQIQSSKNSYKVKCQVPETEELQTRKNKKTG